MKLFKVFFWGMAISFLGTLPLSTLNVAAMQIAIEQSIQAALMFSVGSLLTEVILVRISLVGINWVRKQKVLFLWMEWITLFIVIALSVGSFIAATKSDHPGNVFLNNNMNRFFLGAVMSALTPMQIPFWFGWSTVLFNKKILLPNNKYYNLYILGIGTGTFLGNCIFIFGGQWLVTRLHAHESIFNWIIGIVFAITAIIQLFKIIFHKDAADKISNLSEDDLVHNE